MILQTYKQIETFKIELEKLKHTKSGLQEDLLTNIGRDQLRKPSWTVLRGHEREKTIDPQQYLRISHFYRPDRGPVMRKKRFGFRRS